jgi:hypothetical protein
MRTLLAVLALTCGMVSMAEAKAKAKPNVAKPSAANYKRAVAMSRKSANRKVTGPKVRMLNNGKTVRPAVRTPKK